MHSFISEDFSKYIDVNELVKYLDSNIISDLELHSYNVKMNLNFFKELGIVNFKDLFLKRYDLLLLDYSIIKQYFINNKEYLIYTLNNSIEDLQF